MNKEGNSLANSILKILHTEPVSIDPESNEDWIDSFNLRDSGHHTQEMQQDKLKLQCAEFSGEIGVKYKGRTSVRRRTSDDQHELLQTKQSFLEDLSETEENLEFPDDISDNDAGSAHELLSEDLSESEENLEFAGDDIKEDDAGSARSSSEFNEELPTSQLNKAVCVYNQLNIWEHFLEIRIKLQKSLIAANQIPTNLITNIESHYLDKFESKTSEARESIENVLNKLIHLQSLLLSRYKETKTLTLENQISPIIENEEVPHKRRKLCEYEQQIRVNYNAYKPYRNKIIQKWDDKTRIAITKSNNVFSIIDQIEQSLKTKFSTSKQSQRRDYHISGEILKNQTTLNTNEHRNADTFDDNDFYHKILKEFIETKTAGISDPIKLGKQWVLLQTMRNRLKRNIETRATKGRKIRYTIHSKLVNYMAPVNTISETHGSLHNSLFGKGYAANKTV